MVEIDELEIVDLLQQEVAGIIEDVGARMAADRVQESFEGRAVMQIFARMDFETEIDPRLLERVEDRLPERGKAGKAFRYHSRGALRPGVKMGPQQRA